MNRLLTFAVALWLGIDTCPAPVDFDGTDDYIDCGSSLASVPTSAFSVCFWFNTVPEAYGAAVAFEGTDDLVIYPNQTTSGAGARVFWRDVATTVVREVTGTRSGWHHLVFASYSATDHRLFVDGLEVDSSSASSSAAGPFSNVLIGKYPTQEIDGLLQDVRIYNRALSAAEIETLYKSRIGEGNPVSSGLVGYWPLNDNSGNLASATFVDRTGNGNTGTGSDAGGSGGQCTTETFLTSP